jgi:hypothetical protein
MIESWASLKLDKIKSASHQSFSHSVIELVKDPVTGHHSLTVAGAGRIRVGHVGRLDMLDGWKEGRCSMDVKIKLGVEFSITESGLEDAFDEFDELTVENLIRELLDKSVACDDIAVKVLDGPNTLEEYDDAGPA